MEWRKNRFGEDKNSLINKYKTIYAKTFLHELCARFTKIYFSEKYTPIARDILIGEIRENPIY